MKRNRKVKTAPAALMGAVLALAVTAPVCAAVSADLFRAAFQPGVRTGASEAKMRWSLGDTVVREIDGETYRFRCIDENYSDEMEYHRQAALFLCDTVVPANYGSRYEFETPDDKEHGYVYVPGPIVNFGTSCDYKYSAVRRWLKSAEQSMDGAEPVNIGVSRAYTGSTTEGVYSSFSGGLAGSYIGSQKMTDQLFILSVDEAFKYREWLWRFDGAKEENPESQYGPFSKGYWLRSPAGDCGNLDTGLVYIVDLVNGNIHPAPVVPAKQSTKNITNLSGDRKDAEDLEVQLTGTTGVRPAFVLPQR